MLEFLFVWLYLPPIGAAPLNALCMPGFLFWTSNILLWQNIKEIIRMPEVEKQLGPCTEQKK